MVGVTDQRTDGRAEAARVVRWDGHAARERADALAVEEPLELRAGDATLGVIMRTPGHDRELLRGWLHAEGLGGPQVTLAPHAENPNVWFAQGLTGGTPRLTVTSSACGVCGSGSVERLLVGTPPPHWSAAPLSPALVQALPERLRAAQPTFDLTGGLHAAGLFTPDGALLAAREDIGRHNAVDKLVGWAAARDLLPLTDHLLVISGRCGFEIVQKAVRAGLAVIVGVSAPSSLAVQTAAAFGVTLVGFARGAHFNVYAGAERLRLE